MRRPALMVLSVLPATLLAPVALFALIFGLAVAVIDRSEIPAALLLALWGGAGFIGTCALWSSALDKARRWQCYGLVAGVAAALPLPFAALMEIRSAKTPSPFELIMLIGALTLFLGGALELLRHCTQRPDRSAATDRPA